MFGESSGGGDGTSSGWLAMAKARDDIDEYIQCMAVILSMILNTSVQVGACGSTVERNAFTDWLDGVLGRAIRVSFLFKGALLK